MKLIIHRIIKWVFSEIYSPKFKKSIILEQNKLVLGIFKRPLFAKFKKTLTKLKNGGKGKMERSPDDLFVRATTEYFFENKT